MFSPSAIISRCSATVRGGSGEADADAEVRAAEVDRRLALGEQ
jgi:hypothetical protein